MGKTVPKPAGHEGPGLLPILIMVATTPVRKEITIDTGHTPFLTDPHGLARDIEMAVNPQKTASR